MANLAQMRVLEGLDGFLLVDKPEGLAFATVVKTVKRLFSLVKVGHGGSLEAMASGLLVLLIGDANRFVGDVMGADRAYEGVLDTSYVTNTGDAQGARDEKAARSGEGWPVDLSAFRGDVFQTEPRYAAIRREGTSDYEVVETGDHPQVLGHVYKLELGTPKEGGGAAEVPFRLKATKGVLPRALARDMNATLVSLRRTEQGRFRVTDAVPFDTILKTSRADFPSLVRPISAALRS